MSLSFYRPPLTLLICFALLMAYSAAAGQNGPTVIDNPAIHVLRQQKKVHYMKQGIKTHKQIIKKTSAQNRSLLAELEGIDRQLKEFRDTKDDLTDTIKEQEKLIKNKQIELGKLLSERDTLTNQMEMRLAAYYRMGDIGILNVIFSNSTLSDFLNFNEYFHYIIAYDRDLVSRYRKKITALTEARNKLKQGKKRLLEAEVKVKEQESLLLASRKNRRKLLNEIRTEKTLYLMALKEIEGAADQLTATIKQLKKEAEQKRTEQKQAEIAKSQKITELTASEKKIAKQAAKNGEKPVLLNDSPKQPPHKINFAAQKGLLDPPAEGEVVTFFGRNKQGKFGATTYENGINIKIPSGTDIKAIYDGTVAYSGILRGYGKLMIVDHGNQYYSLISRVARLLKKAKEPVQKGETIAVMSNESGLLNDGLHFEIRHGAQPINPLPWLNKAKLVMMPKHPKTKHKQK